MGMAPVDVSVAMSVAANAALGIVAPEESVPLPANWAICQLEVSDFRHNSIADRNQLILFDF
jgi:hypothetical protein